MKEDFFSKIVYSSSNEDSESERLALQLNNEDSVLCITGSGARSLDLLVDSPKEIVSIDFNPAQNFLLELKIAAFKTLSYDELLEFLGVRSSEDRIILFDKIKKHLSTNALDFWQKRMKLIKDGVLYCGTWERLLNKMLKFAYFRRKKIKALLEATTIEEQQRIWKSKWDTFSWRLFIGVLSNRFLWVKIIREPGAKLIPKDFNVKQYMLDRIEYMAMNFKLSENHYANLLFNGSYMESCILPHHLRPENFDVVRENIERIEIVTASLLDYLPKNKGRFSKFSLSDFSSYAPPEIYHSIWENVIFSAKSGAVFCERYFLVKRNPEKQFTVLQKDLELEISVAKKDISAIYTFGIGVIK
jgi:S-adenosylmethionine-diacylglycerol 3-amino-3-carboxypropyl transferase